MNSEVPESLRANDKVRDDVENFKLSPILPPEIVKVKKKKQPSITSFAEAYKLLPHFEDANGQGIFEELGLVDCVPLALTTVMTMISCQISVPISLCIAGPTSAGKTSVVNAILKNLIPRPWWENTKFSDVTYSSLTRSSNAFKHKIVYVEESCVISGESETFFRLMISGQEYRRTVTGIDGKPHPLLIEGPIAFIQTTSEDIRKIKEDNRNRSLIVYADESPETTRKVMERMAKEAAQGKEKNNEDRFAMIRDRLVRFSELEDSLGYRIDINVPFAPSIVPNLTSSRGMRDFQKMLSIVRTVAWYRRPEDKLKKDPETDKFYLEAEPLDYKIAYPILLLCQHEMADEYGTEIKHWKTVLIHLKGREEFTVSDVISATTRCKSQCQKLIKVWLKLELIGLDKKGLQRVASVYRVLDSDSSSSQVFVHPDALENVRQVH